MTAKLNLDSLDLKALQELQADLQAELDSRRKALRKAALEDIRSRMQESGLSLEDLRAFLAPSRKKKKSAPKSDPCFRNPENAEQTWTGRGRQPKWFQQALSQGLEPEDMKIAS